MQTGLVSVIMVNWNSGHQLARALERLRLQTAVPLELIIVDNGSTDGSMEVASRIEASHAIRTVMNDHNAGFSRAFNQGLAISAGEYVLSLNADVWLQEGFIATLIDALERDAVTGMATGKLLRGRGDCDSGWIIDSTGLFLNRQRRPHDRGQGELDRGQYDRPAEVFGACGAASLCRRRMLDDIACQGEVLDEDFFVYYDDADLSWRAQLRGWRCLYEPCAVAWHERGGGDTLRRRSNAPKLAFAQVHAVKNRYLMMLKNDTWASLVPALPAIIAGDLLRASYVLLCRPAVARAYREVWRLRGRALTKREITQARRRVSDRDMRRWFR